MFTILFSVYLSTTAVADYSGPGLDYTSYNGALLIGPNHTLWGVRIGYIDNNELITAERIEPQVKQSGSYSPDRSFAKLDLGVFVVKWTMNENAFLFAEITAKEDTKLAIETYPAHHYSKEKDIPHPIKNPAQYTVARNGVITGNSPYIKTVAGHTRITGGHAQFTDRSVTIESEEKGTDHFRLEAQPKPNETLNSQQNTKRGFGSNNACMIYNVNKGHKIYIAAVTQTQKIEPFSFACSDFKRIIDTAESQYHKNKLYGTGQLGIGAKPMIDELLWNSTYNPFEKKVFIPAGRAWMADGRYNLWGWDENFCAAVVSLVSYEIAEINTVLNNADERLGPYACWYVYCKYGQQQLLKKCYTVYKELYPPENDSLVKGTGQHNSNVGKGMDDTPMREHSRKLGEMYSLDMTCMKAWNMEILSKIAKQLGHDDEANQYRNNYEKLVRKINDTFWNEDAGIYRNRYISGEWPNTESPTSFYPWLAGVVTDPSRSERLLKNLLDESKFWGQYVIPSLAKDDPQYGKDAFEKHNGRIFPPYCYWRGNIWPPTNFLVYEGLKRAQHDQAASEFASKSTTMWYENWLKTGEFPENFNPVTGKRSQMAHRHQTWSTLFPFIGVKELIDVEMWSDPNAIRFGTFADGENAIYNYRHRNHRYDLEITKDKMSLKRDDKLLIEAIPGNCVIRNYLCTDENISGTIHSKTEQTVLLYRPNKQKPIAVKVSAGIQKIQYPN